ncbi:hypothetical protein J4Q44_G00275170 [Coregonus suidteri]|uniref:Uncharacterized protein n=1 Tax=Coregonus suidteri TaxID=861788 RepID=A0AAN8KUR0_9TELE
MPYRKYLKEVNAKLSGSHANTTVTMGLDCEGPAPLTTQSAPIASIVHNKQGSWSLVERACGGGQGVIDQGGLWEIPERRT